MEQHILAWIAQYGYVAIFAGLMFGIAGLPVPDETLLTFTGYLIYKGELKAPVAAAAALGGSMCGITLSYWLGRTFGMGVIHRYGRYVHIREEHIWKAHMWFERIGHWALTVGYFIPGVRHFTAFAAGMSELEAPQFALYAYSGAVIWVGTFLTIGYFLGERWRDVQGYVNRYALRAGIAAAILAAAYLVWRYWWRRRRAAR
jgi:membrane protein DedA with SNARE-associated domain